MFVVFAWQMEWYSLDVVVVQGVRGLLSRVQSYFQFHCFAHMRDERKQMRNKQT